MRSLKETLHERAKLLEKELMKNTETVQIKYKIEKKLTQSKESLKSLQSLLKKKKKKYKPEEIQNKADRV